ncbi:MAG TPA: hypothetical protein PLB62_13385, partial [Candidatus Sumerlaeota bacterium]|nr:hypothetical protein [Candidatus Sumerlaeota bacterium]
MIIFRMACIIVLSLGQIILGLYMINFASMIVKNRHVKMTLVYSLGPAMSFWFPAICLLEATSPFSEQILRINPSGMPALVAIIALGMGVGLSLYIMVREWLKNRGRHIPSSARLHHSTVYKNRDLGRFLPPILPFSTGRLGNLVNDLYSLEVNEWHVEFDNLPAEFHGFRIGHLTDLHCDKNLDAAYFEACMRLMKSLLPDILVMTGDLISKKGYAEMAADL